MTSTGFGKTKVWSAALTAIVAVSAVTPVAAMDIEVLYETVLDGYYLSSGRKLVVDGEDNVFVAGGFHENLNDVVFARLDGAGTVLWQMLLQGEAIDIVTDMCVDGDGNLLVAGFTDSSDLPTTVDALYPDKIAHRDGFLLKLDRDSGGLLYGTYLGGDHSDQVNALAIGDDGTVYLAGVTDSPDFPVVNPLQGTLANPPYAFNDAFVARLSADLGTLLYSTYLGASRDDEAVGIGIQPNGEMVVAGMTDSTDLAMVEGVQTSFGGGYRDGFAMVLSADGSGVLASTYLGGSDWDQLYGFAIGPGGAVYLGGWTASPDFPTTESSVQPEFAGAINGCEIPFAGSRNCYDGFVVRLTPNLDSLVFGTYLGGDTDDEIRDLAVDRHGRVSVAGYTFSTDFPITVGKQAPALFAARLDPAGRHLEYAVGLDSLGSTNAGHGVAVDRNGASTWVTGARNVPADVLVARVGAEGLLFADAFESATAEVWDSIP